MATGSQLQLRGLGQCPCGHRFCTSGRRAAFRQETAFRPPPWAPLAWPSIKRLHLLPWRLRCRLLFKPLSPKKTRRGGCLLSHNTGLMGGFLRLKASGSSNEAWRPIWSMGLNWFDGSPLEPGAFPAVCKKKKNRHIFLQAGARQG